MRFKFHASLVGWLALSLILCGRLSAQTVLLGSYDNQTIADDVSIAASTTATFLNGSTFTGANGTINNSAGLFWQQVGALTGKNMTIGTNSYIRVNGAGYGLGFNSSTLSLASGAYLYLNGVNTSLTLDSATSLSGDVSIYSDGSANTSIINQGTLTHSVSTGQIYATNFTNEGSITATAGTLYLNYPSAGYNATNAATGTVTADGSGTTIYLRGNFDNNGTVTAQNSGVLQWDGTTTTANLGNVVIASGGHARLNGTVDNTAGTITAPTGGTFELYGGTIQNGTIASGALSFTTSGGYLDGASLTGDLTLAATSSYVRMLNGANFTGSNLTLANSAGVYWQQAGSLTNKTITIGSGGYLYLSGANSSLTLDATTTVSGDVSIYSDGSANTTIINQGTLTHSVSTGQIYATNFTNEGSITATAGTLYLNYPSAGYNATNAATGTVTADGSGTTIYLRGNFDNNGTLTAQNSGVLLWDGTTTSANLGNVVIASGGHARLNGTVDNTSGTITAPTGGTFELYGGTIQNGTIASGALSFTTSGGYLDGASLTGDLTLATTSSYVRMLNGTNFTGSNLTLTNSAGVYWQQAASLVGKTISLGSGSYLYLSGANSSLTLDATTTVTGDVSIYSDGSANTTIINQGTITHSVSTGQIYASNFTNEGTVTATAGTLYLNYPSVGYNATNAATGTMTADGASTTIYLRGNFDNNGTLTAQNSGQLLWDGNNTTANLGNVVLATGGRALLNGIIDNTAATLTAPSGGSYELYGGTIKNGTIASGALAFTTSGGYLDGTTLTGDLTLAATGSLVRLTNAASFTGSNLAMASSAGLYWQQTGTLAGKTITQGNGSYIYVTGAGNTLTLDSATTDTGTISIYTDTSVGTAITNQGTLTHNAGTGYLYAPTLVNQGSVAVNGGTFYFGYYATHSSANAAGGSITVNGGSNLYVYTPLTNAGQILIQGGTMYTGNNVFTNSGTGLIGGAGTINGDLTLAGGTLAPGNAGIGTLTVTSSDFLVTAPTVFTVDMDGSTSDRLTFQTPTSAVDLGAGLLTLSINLLTAPTQGTTYTLSNIASGAFGYTGYFANVPNSGDALIANFAGTDYTLNVYYLANSIILQVPEPSTYALMGAGLAILALRWRRRRC